MNTFFFGYLSLKWRRLARVLSLLSIILSFILIEIFIQGVGDFLLDPFNPLGFIIFLIPSLVSYTLKPFINKNKS